jgi:hemoglobin
MRFQAIHVTMTTFGIEDASYCAAGKEPGIGQLVEDFYRYMDTLEAAATIRAMHPKNLSLSKEKLKVFLTGWLGGPRTYSDRFGPIRIPLAHAHLAVDESERDAWLLCMNHAVNEQPWAPEFKAYFMQVIAVPAERVRLASVARRQG